MTKQNVKVTEKKHPAPASEQEQGGLPPSPASNKEIGGFEDRRLPEPTRYGDWEVGGRCSDF